MPSLKIIRKEQTVVDIRHTHNDTIYTLYNLLLANDALEGGDIIIHKDKKSTQKYHLCMTCRKRAIENINQTCCSLCAKSVTKVTPVSLPSNQTFVEAPTNKPKPDYSKYYKF